jgi:hypothetical protein
MSRVHAENLDLILVEDTVWVLVGRVDLPSYDFALDQFFVCRRPRQRPEQITAIGRFGVASNYDELCQQLSKDGISLVHSPEQHWLASELPHWYPKLEGLTPKSTWFKAPPALEQLEPTFQLPLFIKGSRQTSRHKAALSIARTPEDYERIIEAYANDPILHWQEFVIRELVDLRPVVAAPTDKVPASFEFRTFWWKGHCIGAAQYWATSYTWTQTEELSALGVARAAAIKLELAFVVIDVAQKTDGEWIVIECNDAQESGYGAISPFTLWQNLIQVERALASSS